MVASRHRGDNRGVPDFRLRESLIFTSGFCCPTREHPWCPEDVTKMCDLAYTGNHLVPDLYPPFSRCAGSTLASASLFMGTDISDIFALIRSTYHCRHKVSRKPPFFETSAGATFALLVSVKEIRVKRDILSSVPLPYHRILTSCPSKGDAVKALCHSFSDFQPCHATLRGANP
jgi:hypothetical protein